MSMSAPIDLVLTAIALAGVFVALSGVSQTKRPSIVADRLRVLYGLLAAFFSLRLLNLLLPTAFFNGATLLVAAWLPFAQLRLAEDIVRFHAAKWVKLFTLIGALALSVLTLLSGFVPSAAVLIGLALYQISATVFVILLLRAHRSDVSGADRGLADTFVLALLLVAPLALTDFRELFADAPVRGGAFAVLVLVLATSHFVSGHGKPSLLLRDIGISGAAGAILGVLMLVSAPSLGFATGIQIMACGVATTGLILLLERFATDQRASSGLVHALAQVSHRSDRASLLEAHPLLSQGRLLDGPVLADYPEDTIKSLLSYPILTGQTGPEALRDATRDLLDRYAATHLVRVTVEPPQLLAISAGELAGPSLDDDLALVARLIEGAR